MSEPNETTTGAPESATLRLELDGRALSVQIRREARVRSPHTGRELQELHGWMTTPDPAEHEWLAARLRALPERPLRSTDEAGEFAGKWIVSWNSYAEAAGVHTYALILREEEELSLEALVVDDLELHPYEYREQMVGEGLTVWAKLVGTEEDLEALRRKIGGREPFPVIRRGIREEARPMRLGVGEWSVFEDRVKYRVILVDAEMNEETRLELARIEEENSRAALGYYENFIERLADLLVRRGVLSPEEILALREESRASPGGGRREFWRVADVDALP